MLAGETPNKTISLHGYPGRLSLVGNDPREEGCFLWRTDPAVLRRSEKPADGSLFDLACDVADLYHQQRPVSLAALPNMALEVIWLELADDDSLLVFLKPRPVPERLGSTFPS